MDRNQKKIVYALLCVLSFSLLMVALAFSLKSHKPQPTEDAPKPETQDVSQEPTFQSIQYCNGSATLSFTRNPEGHWIWADDPEFPLKETYLRELAALLSDLKFQETLSGEASSDDLYGFQTPTATLDATREDGSSLSLVLGKKTPDQKGYYLQMDHQESTAYVISDRLYQSLQTPIYEMCRLPELPILSEAEVQSLTVSGAVSTELRHSGEIWKQGSTEVTEQPALSDLLGLFSQWSLQRCVDYRPSEKAGELCGFHAPAAVLELQYLDAHGTRQELRLSVGAVMPKSGEEVGRFVRLNGEAPIYQMNEDLLQPLLALASQGLT